MRKKHKIANLDSCRFWKKLFPEDNGNQNPEGSYTSKYQQQVACSYCCLLACADDKFSNPFKSYLSKGPFTDLFKSTNQRK